MHRYDLNEDGILSRDELLPSAERYGYRAGKNVEAGSQLAATLASAGSARAVALRILGKYDTGLPAGMKAGPAPAGKDGRLSAAELGWTTDAPPPLDADGDGLLDFDELARLAANPAATVQFTARQAGSSAAAGSAAS